MTPQQLQIVMPFSVKRADIYAPLLTFAMVEFGIDTPKRQSAFIAQLAHESGELKYTEELGPDSYFSKYEFRADLGNTETGDGLKYKGRGLIQVTGRANYAKCGHALQLDLINSPELLEQPLAATRSACWFWSSRSLNELADKNYFGAITKRINGGYNGLDERINYYLIARKVLGL